MTERPVEATPARRGIPPPSGTSARGLLGTVLLLIGAVTGTAPIVLVGLVVLLLAGVHWIWARWGLRGVEYRRDLPTTRAVFGDDLPLLVSVRNAKRLPLSWLQADDELHPPLPVRERPPGPVDRPEFLPNTWSLGPHERVVRRYHLVASKRGVFEIGPTHLRAGDLFGATAASRDVPVRDTFLVRPRTIPVRERRPQRRWDGDLRATRGLLENTSLFAGVREYQVGDPLRRVHWKASARLGRPVSKRFDPARERAVMLVVDIQGSARRGTSLSEEDLLEGLCVVAASLSRGYERAGASFGLAAAGFSGSVRPFAYLAPSEAVGQLGRVLDLLARLSAVPSAPFTTLLTTLPRLMRPGTTIAVLTAREPTPFLPALRRLALGGFPTMVIGYGPTAEQTAGLARRAGIAARVATLDGTWRTSEQLTVSG